MKLGTRKQQPGERRRYGIDYSGALDKGDGLLSVSHLVEPAGLTVSSFVSEEYIRIIVEGGVDKSTYKITLTVTTTDENEILEDEIYIKVKEI